MTTSTIPVVGLLRSRDSVREFLPTPMSASPRFRGGFHDQMAVDGGGAVSSWDLHRRFNSPAGA